MICKKTFKDENLIEIPLYNPDKTQTVFKIDSNEFRKLSKNIGVFDK